MNIAAVKTIQQNIEEKAWSFVPAEAICLPDDAAAAWTDLLAEYDDLPPDEFLPNNARYRFRRFGRYYFHPASDELLPLPHTSYFQSTDINTVTGGITREFAPLKPETFENRFLQELVRWDFNQFPVDEQMRALPWQVDVHLVRVVAQTGFNGEPTPEGIHQDGAEFITVHLAEHENVVGGTVTIYDLDKEPLHSLTLNRILDSYFFEDPRVWHGVTPITPADKSRPGKRSILTFDYHFDPELQRPE